MPCSLMFSAGHVIRAALLTRIFKESVESCCRTNLQEPSSTFVVATITETFPPSALAALPSVSHGQLVWDWVCEVLCGTLGVPYCAWAPAAEADKSSNESKGEFNIAYSRPSLSPASLVAPEDQTSGSYRLPV